MSETEEQPVPTEEAHSAPLAVDSSQKKNRINTYFKTLAAVNGSDIHIKSDAIPRVRVGGELRTLKTEPLSPPEVDAMIAEMLSEEQLSEYNRHGTIDLAYAFGRGE